MFRISVPFSSTTENTLYTTWHSRTWKPTSRYGTNAHEVGNHNV